MSVAQHFQFGPNHVSEYVFTFPMNDLYKNTGTQIIPDITRDLSDLVRPARLEGIEGVEEVGIVLWWSREHAHFKLEIDAECGGKTVRLTDNGQLAKMINPKFDADKYCFLTAVVPLRGQLRIKAEVDTDHRSFAASQPDTEGGVTIPLAVYWVVRGGRVDNAHGWDGYWLRIRLTPCLPMPTYPGCVALDLGNTNTTMVYGSVDAWGELAARLVKYRPSVAPNEGPLPSALRVVRRHAPPRAGDYFGYECLVGREALAQSNGHLMLGAKRLLSDDATSSKESVLSLNGQPVAVPHREPVELFLAEVFRAFYNHAKRYPTRMTLTCPTTFSGWEVEQLRQAVYHAWRRSLGLPALADDDPTLSAEVDRLVANVIDEASAAAFHFLYRDYFTGPGRLPIFRYLYPNGMHMLLYDCGGGTTDISLVKAEAVRDKKVQITVLGRAGHRQFGGDAITAAVFRILKAKIAGLRSGIVKFPELGRIRAGLDAQADAIDSAVPTRYEFDALTDQRDRSRALTMVLWQIAEGIKCGLSEKSPAMELKNAPNKELLIDLKNRLGFVQQDLKVEGIVIRAAEVNELIDDDIRETIRYANQLIRRSLSGGLAEVDAVYVVGNASLYPRIKDLMKQRNGGLNVRFIEERMQHVPPEDLKNAVAKGALLAMNATKHLQGFSIDFDKELVNRLPFSITYRSLDDLNDQVLFPENAPYHKLVAPRVFRVVPGSPEGDANGRSETQQGATVLLKRLWPGDSDEKATRYLSFTFAESVGGEVRVYYDLERKRFIMEETSNPLGQGGVEGLPPDEQPYRSPPESGAL